METYIIGDIHGEITQLKELLNKINYNNKNKIICLGDYIDRGEDSLKTYNFLREMKHENKNVVLLRGNHEQMMIDALLNKKIDHNLYKKEEANIIWQQNGGGKTILDFKRNKEKLIEAAKWFNKMPYVFEGENHICVHAGIKPNKRLYQQDKSDFLWIREEFIKANKLKTNKIVIAGHTPYDKPQVLGNKVLIDTGAGKGGKITAMDLNKGIFINP